jgi:hypothetical protein
MQTPGATRRTAATSAADLSEVGVDFRDAMYYMLDDHTGYEDRTGP